MPKFALALISLAASAFAAGAAQAQPAQSPAPARSPDVTVRAPERMVCRAQVRTSTRMRTGRVCRTVREWEEARGGRSQDEVLAEAAQTLDVLSEAPTTLCEGGMAGNPGTSLGPR